MSSTLQLARLVRRWPSVIFNQRPDLSFEFVNDKIEEWTGVAVAEWQRDSKWFRDVIHESDLGALQQQLKRAAETPSEIITTFRIRHVKTGRVTYVREHREALVSRSGLLLGYEGIWVDVSRQTIAERRLSSASWMETLAVLTASLAHDFSNVNAGVQSLTEAFQAQLPNEHPFQEGLALIQDNTQKAIQSVRRMRSLHQGKAGEWAYHDLNELVKELLELVRKTVPRRLQIQMELASFSLPIFADAVELRQVFVNLVLNAIEAMPQPGTLTIQTARYDVPPTATSVQGALPAGPSVCLRVQDEGTGIPPRHLEAIFDPFFTTKPANQGAGLGLYSARLFVEKHRGAISVDSVENVGSTFSLWLPQADFTEADRQRPQPRLGRHTVLLVGPPGSGVDDAVLALRQQGHYVVTTGSGSDARELLASPDYEFTAVMALVPGPTAVPESLFELIRRQRLRVKTILQLVGCHQDEFTAQSFAHADLVLPPHLAAQEVLTRIQAALEEN